MNWNAPVRWGIIGGLTSIIITLLVDLISPVTFAATWFGFLLIGLSLFFMIWGGLNFRKENGNEITFVQSLGAVFLIAIISLVLSITFSYVLYNFIDTDLGEIVKQATRIKMDSWLENASDEVREQAFERLEKEGGSFTLKQAGMALGMGAIMNGIISLIVAAFVKRNPDKAQAAENVAE